VEKRSVVEISALAAWSYVAGPAVAAAHFGLILRMCFRPAVGLHCLQANYSLVVAAPNFLQIVQRGFQYQSFAAGSHCSLVEYFLQRDC